MKRILLILGLACLSLRAQQPDPAADPVYQTLDGAYQALRSKDYDEAIRLFTKAIESSPERPAIHKDLAYTYLKVGDTLAAREEFGAARRLDPNDFHVALEYAFLCFETKERATARRIFDTVRRSADTPSSATAEQAFQNIDRSLAEGIARWSEAVRQSPENFSAHHELAGLAEERDQLDLAEKHYREAWRLRPDLRYLLLDLGRVWKAQGKPVQANAALLAASRGAEPRTAEAARALLPARYPYLDEFRGALELDPKNIDLRRELAYLLLELNRKPEAEKEFQAITQIAPDDLLSAAQLGFLRLSEKDSAGAMPLLKRVLDGNDPVLAGKVRAALKLPPVLQERPDADPVPENAVQVKALALRSYEAGYMKDALKYLQLAHEDDPVDFSVMLKLGWTYNVLHDDDQAVRWFDLARRSPDPAIAREASKAYRSLRSSQRPVSLSFWTFPMYSSRWGAGFLYGQGKVEFKIGSLPVHPYLSLRLIGDTGNNPGGPLPQYLSESSIIAGVGLRTTPWHRLVLWGEAGSAISYLSKRRENMGNMLPDYRGGAAWSKGLGNLLGGEAPGRFYETNADGVFISRFNNDFLVYSQHRAGYTLPTVESLGGLQAQVYWNGNLTADAQQQYWANYVEFGPGVQFRWRSWPSALRFSVNLLRGVYTVNEGNPRKPNFYDVRTGLWYAFLR